MNDCIYIIQHQTRNNMSLEKRSRAVQKGLRLKALRGAPAARRSAVFAEADRRERGAETLEEAFLEVPPIGKFFKTADAVAPDKSWAFIFLGRERLGKTKVAWCVRNRAHRTASRVEAETPSGELLSLTPLGPLSGSVAKLGSRRYVRENTGIQEFHVERLRGA